MAIMHRFDAKKAVEVVLYIAQKVSDMYVALKVLYFADKEHLYRYGRLICGDSYVALKHGPVPSGTYDLVKFARSDGWCPIGDYVQDAFEIEDYDIVPIRKPNIDLLSISDRECLDEAIGQYGHLTFGKLQDLCHQDKAFQAVDRNDFIPLEAIIETLPDSELLKEYLEYI